MRLCDLLAQISALGAGPDMTVRADGAEPEVSVVHEDEGDYLNIGGIDNGNENA